MLIVKNTSQKIIGPGGIPILPGEIKTLDAGFGRNHPNIKWFLDKGWLTEIRGAGVLVPPGVNVETPPVPPLKPGGTLPDPPPLPGGSTETPNIPVITPTNDTPPVLTIDLPPRLEASHPDLPPVDTPSVLTDPDTIDTSALTNRDVSRMGLGNLQKLAKQLGIEVGDGATRKDLITPISTALFPSEAALIEEPEEE